MNFKHVWPYVAMAAAMTTVGSTIVASKLMAQMPIFVAMLVRFAVASLVKCIVRPTLEFKSIRCA